MVRRFNIVDEGVKRGRDVIREGDGVGMWSPIVPIK